MADNIEVLASAPLLLRERRKSISLMLVRFIGVVLLAVATFYLFVGNFSSWTGSVKNVNKQELVKNSRPLMKELGVKEQQYLKQEVCDLSVGKWIPKPEGPLYTNETCDYMASYTNCLKNGRPDSGFLHWKWQPNGCDLPPFDPLKFLNAMRNKSFALIGDSVFRNHARSLLCLLSVVAKPDEIYHDRTNSGIFYYSEYNFTIYDIWSPFLVSYKLEKNLPDLELYLDVLDSQWTKNYDKYDYMLMSGSHWFYRRAIIYENNKVIGCHYCPDLELNNIATDVPYRKALELTFKFITTSEHKPFVVLRTWSPNHFEDGEFSGSRICNKTEPFKEGEINGDPADLLMRSLEVEEFEKAAAIGEKNGLRIELLDTYHLSLLRPDGHPGAYRNYHPFDGGKKNVENDCIHWCVPGPIDTWSELLMKIVIP
ncbi:protein trichome birefringence-like 26 isoform X1 [Dioscorea cayenensis subsp. rotundata]|uniref:Protein trichome birefringence-like 26 isoform X1 n=1 Tax=Dioscorea cayennensis subsp. rotundata TaxID=55577 RepID=A0AB40AZM7_DIOCR|nr:protein trichome birefringence-like 26 isoform X1 [Dioscorea cayenensis subsp. rotundata]